MLYTGNKCKVIYKNKHRTNTYKENKAKPTFKIAHFTENYFIIFKLEIKEHLVDKNDRLTKENNYIFKFRILCNFDFILLSYNVNINNIVNDYVFMDILSD